MVGWVGCFVVGFREEVRIYFLKLKRGKRMLFLMKIVKFLVFIMIGLWARIGGFSFLGRGRGDKGGLFFLVDVFL